MTGRSCLDRRSIRAASAATTSRLAPKLLAARHACARVGPCPLEALVVVGCDGFVDRPRREQLGVSATRASSDLLDDRFDQRLASFGEPAVEHDAGIARVQRAELLDVLLIRHAGALSEVFQQLAPGWEACSNAGSGAHEDAAARADVIGELGGAPAPPGAEPCVAKLRARACCAAAYPAPVQATRTTSASTSGSASSLRIALTVSRTTSPLTWTLRLCRLRAPGRRAMAERRPAGDASKAASRRRGANERDDRLGVPMRDPYPPSPCALARSQASHRGPSRHAASSSEPAPRSRRSSRGGVSSSGG